MRPVDAAVATSREGRRPPRYQAGQASTDDGTGNGSGGGTLRQHPITTDSNPAAPAVKRGRIFQKRTHSFAPAGTGGAEKSRPKEQAAQGSEDEIKGRDRMSAGAK